MSASMSYSRVGWFGKLTGLLRARDPMKKSILESVATLDRMIRTIESSKKSLDSVLEEHQKRVKLLNTEGDKEFQDIINEEISNIVGYKTLFEKAILDLARVRYRLETLAYVEEPMKELPAVMEELQRIEPEVAKIAPDLLNQLRSLRKKVEDIIIETAAEPSPSVSGKAVAHTAKVAPQSRVEKEESALLPPPPPAEVKVPESNIEVKEQPQAIVVKKPEPVEVSLHVVEQWLLDELRSKGGILDVSNFISKYRVKKEAVYLALRSLESKGVIKLKRF
jgi:division protein CdvB (Snf7/Vps24/ESCRT-III family)